MNKESVEKQKDQKFLDEYKKLCEKYKRGLSTVPAWRFSPDGNDFRLIINIAVQRWPENMEQ